MSETWAVLQWFPYEGQRFRGIYDTADLAKSAVEEYATKENLVLTAWTEDQDGFNCKYGEVEFTVGLVVANVWESL